MTSQDWANWVGAIGTAGATLIAVITLAIEARWRRRAKQREQAEYVTAWTLGDVIRISHRSSAPVYYCVVAFVVDEQDGRNFPNNYKQIITVVPPGEWQLEAPEGWQGMCHRPGTEIMFTDIRGAHWMRNAVGRLSRHRVGSIKYYSIGLPYMSEKLMPAGQSKTDRKRPRSS